MCFSTQIHWALWDNYGIVVVENKESETLKGDIR